MFSIEILKTDYFPVNLKNKKNALFQKIHIFVNDSVCTGKIFRMVLFAQEKYFEWFSCNCSLKGTKSSKMCSVNYYSLHFHGVLFS